MPPLSPAELADLRRTLKHPMAQAQLWPSSVLDGLFEEIDRVTEAFDERDDDLDRFIRQQVLAEPRFAVEYLHSGACAKLRAVRHRHETVTYEGVKPYCAWCSHIAGTPVAAPCPTIQDIGVEDESESLAASRGQGSPRARALAAMSTPNMVVDGIDLSRTYADREGVKWCCIGLFQAWGRDAWDPMMSTMTGRWPDYNLKTWLEMRGPVTLADGAATLLAPTQAPQYGEVLVFPSISAGIEGIAGQR